MKAADQQLVRARMRSLFFKKGQLVFHEHGIPTGVYFLEEGKAKIFKVGINGKEQIFYIYKQGDLLGYHSVICDEYYMDSCETLEPCKVSFISRDDFFQLMDEIPEFRSLLIKNLGHEFAVMVNTITILAQKTVRERLAIYLIVLRERYRESSHQEPVISLPREDLANVIGTARETLTRLLREFKEAKYIHIHKREIRILDIKELKKQAAIPIKLDDVVDE
ncbi:MAG: Crp/Fnr family transcriptional regulator [Flammeovirgaceae bacterium]